MKREHMDLLDLSTLKSALRSVVEGITDELGRGGARKMVNKLSSSDSQSIKEGNSSLRQLKLNSHTTPHS